VSERFASTSDEDRRHQALALTAKGRAIVPRLADKNDAQFFGPLAVAERQRLEQVTHEIVCRHGLKSVPVE
jgi:DNA-binding MarR family transcriptional regulator